MVFVNVFLQSSIAPERPNIRPYQGDHMKFHTTHPTRSIIISTMIRQIRMSPDINLLLRFDLND